MARESDRRMPFWTTSKRFLERILRKDSRRGYSMENYCWTPSHWWSTSDFCSFTQFQILIFSLFRKSFTSKFPSFTFKAFIHQNPPPPKFTKSTTANLFIHKPEEEVCRQVATLLPCSCVRLEVSANFEIGSSSFKATQEPHKSVAVPFEAVRRCFVCTEKVHHYERTSKRVVRSVHVSARTVCHLRLIRR